MSYSEIIHCWLFHLIFFWPTNPNVHPNVAVNVSPGVLRFAASPCILCEGFPWSGQLLQSVVLLWLLVGVHFNAKTKPTRRTRLEHRQWLLAEKSRLPIHPRAFRGFSRTRKERLLVGLCFPTTRIAWVLDLGDCATSDGKNKGKSSKRWLGYAWTEAYMLLICEHIAIYIFRFVQFFLDFSNLSWFLKSFALFVQRK
jgi:hypothetical protein